MGNILGDPASTGGGAAPTWGHYSPSAAHYSTPTPPPSQYGTIGTISSTSAAPLSTDGIDIFCAYFSFSLLYLVLLDP